LTNEEYTNYQKETFEHLLNGRFRLALKVSEMLYKERPEDSDTVICLAWSLLENGNPMKAMDYANMAVELKPESPRVHLYRGYLLQRMSIYEGAISDFDFSIKKNREYLSWTYRNKALSYAGSGKFDDAIKTLDLAILIDKKKIDEWGKSKEWFEKARKIKNGKIKVESNNLKELISDCEEAIETKEYWYALYLSRKILDETKSKKDKLAAELIELEAQLNLFQYKPAIKKAESLKSKFKNDKKFDYIYKALLNFDKKQKEYDPIDLVDEKNEQDVKRMTFTSDRLNSTMADGLIKKSDVVFYPNEYADVFAAKMFNAKEEAGNGKKRYFIQFNKNKISNIGVEVVFNNPNFRMKDSSLNCEAKWYLNDFEIGKNKFLLDVKNSWDSVVFAQTWGSDKEDYWKEGQAKVEIYIEDFKVCERWFYIGDSSILHKEEKLDKQKKKVAKSTKEEIDDTYQIHYEEEKSLDELLAELDEYVGLSSIKNSVRDFVNYLEYLKERKRHGLKSDEQFSIHSVFLGNPGTGKTTIARLVGQIFKAMGILEKGHVIEVDRSGLVGQYIGETAQKTDKVIQDAMGGVLFIDEAYTFIKQGSGQDFGQEAIDILLKRMEDFKGKFSVIVAGYPEEMNKFIESNPGLKSRFNRFFIFDDYTPDELLEIFKKLLSKEEYLITDKATELVKKEFMNLFRNRDKTFGNARIAKKFFEDAKINLSRRYLELDKKSKTKDALTKIIEEDISSILTTKKEKEVRIPINEDELMEALAQLNTLVGLDSIKNEVRDLIKLARYYIEQGEDIKEKFSSHFLFLGNPGTGKTTVSRILSKIYSALGILSRGHLVEVDRQGLVASYVGQTAEKTTQIIDRAIGGTLFIDEAYALVKKGSQDDFGKEAIDTLLKRMEDERGKFMVIAAGYTDEMNNFINSNPGIQSRFTKSFFFEDYSPDELMEITKTTLSNDKIHLNKSAEDDLLKYYKEIYRTRDKKFGNGRIVRNILENAKNKMLLRLADLSPEERNKKSAQEIISEDLKDFLNVQTHAKRYDVEADQVKLDQYLRELDKLVGLNSIKKKVDKLIKGLKVAKLRKERGLKVVERNLNFVFSGNPGTGKTTIARLLSKIFKHLGLLEKGHLVEVDRSDLVAGYIGQTAIKTDNIIKQALGGILFINDAYSLIQDENDFGHEAIETIIKRMDEHAQLVVIVSGASDEMEIFINSNPALNSHFNNFFSFDDYNPRELLEITAILAEQNGYKLDEGALQVMLEILTDLFDKRGKDFGNARTVKNILYKCISIQEERISNLFDLTDEDLMTITYEDMEKMNLE